MTHYHAYIGYGGHPPRFWAMYGAHARIGWTVRMTAHRIARQVAGSQPAMIRQCKHKDCDVIEGTPDKG